MSRQKIIRRVLHICIFSVFLLLLLHAFLPAAAAYFVNAFLGDYAEHGIILFELKRFSLSQIEFAFAVTPPEESRFGAQSSYASCVIDYSLPKLLRTKHIDAVAIHGVHFPVNLADGKLNFPLLTVLKHTGTAEKTSESDNSNGFRLNDLPVSIGKFEVDGNMVFNLPKGSSLVSEKVFVPVSLELTSDSESWDKLHYSLDVIVSGVSFHAGGVFYPAENLLDGTTEIQADTRLLPYTARKKYLPMIECSADIAVHYRYRLPEELPEKVDFKGNFSVDADFGNGLTVACRPMISVAGDKDAVKAELSGLQCRMADLPLALDGSFTWHRAGKCLDGVFTPRIGETFALPLIVTLKPEADCWKLNLKTAETLQGAQELFGVTLPDALRGAIELNLKNSGIAFQTHWQIPGLKTAIAGHQLSAGAVEVKADGSLEDYCASVSCRQLAAHTPLYQAELPELSLSLAGKGLDTWNGELAVSGAKAALPELDLAVNDISVRFPFSQTGGKGALEFGKILFHGQETGKIATEILWHGGKAVELANGKFTLCRLTGDFSAQAGVGECGAECEAKLTVPRQALADNLGLTELFPEQMDDKTFSGEAELQADFAYKNGVPQGSAALAVHDLAFDSEKLGIHVSGIRTKFELPRLPELASKPNMLFSFKEAHFGPVSTGSGMIFYRMDAPKSWCIERLMVNWCDGMLRMESTYFSPDSKMMLFTVHCERLDLMSFLMQTGIGTGEGNGEGKITGTLPVIFMRNGSNVIVRDGFLYTTPGEEGNIKLELSEAVMGTAPGVMMALAQEALRDFSYSWAKIGVNTKDDTLAVALQLNGKPNQPLFYTYQNGEFVKTKIPHIFQGILLDVNFGVPCSELFYLYNQWNTYKNNSTKGEESL